MTGISPNTDNFTNGNKPPGGTLYVVGDGEVYGELGLSDMPHVYDPTTVFDLEYESVISISSSRLHSLAVTRNGTLWSWGCEDYGALGRTGLATNPRPITHPSIRYIRFKKVACGNSMSMALSSKDQLYTWGTFHSSEGIYGYLPNVEVQHYPRIVNNVASIRFIDIAAGASHCLALDNRGYVYSWGCGEYGHLGRPELQSAESELSNQCLLPKRLEILTGIVAIACGAFHSLALDKDGRVYSWGLNHFHQCGLVEKIFDNSGTTIHKHADKLVEKPTIVPYFQSSVIKLERETARTPTNGAPTTSIDAGRNGNSSQKCSRNNNQNGKSQSTVKAELIAAGDYHSVAVMSDNTLRVWGRCDSGQLGISRDYIYPGSFRTPEVATIYAIGYPTDNSWQCDEKIEKVVCGAEHTLVMSKYGTVWGFGNNASNQLGLFRSQDSVLIPTLLNSVNTKGAVVNMSAGDQCSMFVIVEDDKQLVKIYL